MEIKVENQGITNGQRFTNMNGEVDIDKAFDYYMPSTQSLKSNLRYFIENNYTDEQIMFHIKGLADSYYTIFKSYQENKPL